ncbi:hypothetical protein XENORESO_020912, partial [Xenotaenia resolanae]
KLQRPDSGNWRGEDGTLDLAVTRIEDGSLKERDVSQTHTQLHDTDSHRLLTEATLHLEGASVVLPGTYLHTQNPAFKRMPMFSMMVMGEEISFVVDSGATHSVLSAKCIKEQPKLSGRYVHSVSASGETVRESFAVPLKCCTNGRDLIKTGLVLLQMVFIQSLTQYLQFGAVFVHKY